MPKINSIRKVINTSTIYDKMLEDRGVRSINILIYQYQNKVYVDQFRRYKYIWKKGDNLFRLSNKFYNTKDYWWIIAFCNRKPTDSHFEIGDEVFIPTSASDVLRALENVS